MAAKKKFVSLKIYGLIALITTLGLFLFLGLGQFRSLTNVNKQINEYIIESGDWKNYQSELVSTVGYGGLIHNFKNYVIRYSDKYFDRIENNYQQVEDLSIKLNSLKHFSPEASDSLAVIIETMKNYRDNSLIIRESISEGLLVNELDKIVKIDDTPALEAINILSEEYTKFSELEKLKLEKSLSSAFNQLIIILAASIIILVFIVLLISKFISRELQIIISTTQEMAKGNLSINVPVHTQDVIGKLSENFNNAIHGFKSIIAKISDSAYSNEKIGTDLSVHIEDSFKITIQMTDSIESIMNQIQNLTDQIGGASTAVEEIFANIESLVGRIKEQVNAVTQTSASIEEMAASINNVANIADHKKSAADKLVSITADGNMKVNSTNDLITAVSARVENILEMNDMINNIASQTNLLSMNAAIEAAHAGDSGKGFAVVADEIRNLAESTSSNSTEINQNIKDLEQRINEALTSSSLSGKAFDDINFVVKDVSNAFEEIISSTQELSAGSNDILDSTILLKNISEEIKFGSDEMHIGTKEINDAIHYIKQISLQTNSAISEINNGAKEIRTLTDNISELGNRNKDLFSKLKSDISRFKV